MGYTVWVVSEGFERVALESCKKPRRMQYLTFISVCERSEQMEMKMKMIGKRK